MTAKSLHPVVAWLDQHEAHLFRLEGASSFEESTFRSAQHHVHRHPKHDGTAKDHPDDAKRFFHDIAQALNSSDEVLIVGPSTAKLHFLKYVHAHDSKLEARIVGVETVDHPTDGQLAAFARHYFLEVQHAKKLTP